MKLPVLFQKLKSLSCQLKDERVVLKQKKPIILYDYDREGNVRFTNAGRYYWYFDLFVDSLREAASKSQERETT